MPRDLFGDVSDPSVRVGSRKWYTVPLSLFVHTVVLLLVVDIPLVATGALPDPRTTTVWVPAVPALPQPPPVARVRPPEQPRVNANAAPIEAPDSITKEPEFDPGFEDTTGTASTFIDGVAGGTGELEPPPPPPPAVVKPPAPVRVGGSIKQPTKVRDVRPVYPPIAQSARVSGMVIIEATIGADGRVKDAKVLRSSPLLDQAALDAVKQWQFTPTLLNNVPVPVIMTVTVNFTLQ